MGFIGRTINNFIRKQKTKQFIATINNLPKQLPPINANESYVTFSHIGHLGDIVYSMPAMFALAQGKKIRLYFDTTATNTYTKAMKHHSGKQILTNNSITFLQPLLLAQPQFEICEKWNGEAIDYNLNDIKKYPFDYKYGNIVRWYFLTFGINYNTTLPWLQVVPNNNYSQSIIIARSFRYRSPLIDYSFLSKYNNISFVGLHDEYEDIQKQIPNITHIKTNTALDLAQIIAGCKLFIGNQSFPFAVAEALKVKRVLELYFLCPNVIVDGNNGYDFCYQPQFEKIIKNILE